MSTTTKETSDHRRRSSLRPTELIWPTQRQALQAGSGARHDGARSTNSKGNGVALAQASSITRHAQEPRQLPLRPRRATGGIYIRWGRDRYRTRGYFPSKWQATPVALRMPRRLSSWKVWVDVHRGGFDLASRLEVCGKGWVRDWHTEKRTNPSKCSIIERRHLSSARAPPRPCARSCWRARSRRPSWVAGRQATGMLSPALSLPGRGTHHAGN